MTSEAGLPRTLRAKAPGALAQSQAEWTRYIARARLRALGVALRLDSARVCASIGALAYLAFLMLRLSAHGGDFSAFVDAGDHFADPARVPPGLHVQPQSWGYDGQYYYTLALDPFTSKGRFAGLWLDNPPYRQQRILYPLIVWALSLGHASLVPVLLVLVNYLALIGIAWVGALYAQSVGRHALWGLLVALYPGFVLSIARDLPDALAVLLVVASLVLLRRSHSVWATLCLTLAIFTRETTVMVACAAALGLAAGWAAKAMTWTFGRSSALASVRGRAAEMLAPWQQTLRASPPARAWSAVQTHPKTAAAITLPWHYAVVPVAALAIWQYLLMRRWHVVPALTGRGNLARPFLGIRTRLENLTPPASDTYAHLLALETRFLVGVALVVALALWVSRARALVKVAWVITLGLSILASPIVWGEDWGFVRAFSDFFVLGVLILLAGPSWNRRAALVATLGMWTLLALTRIGPT
jgi:hypothetical protein